LATRTAQDFGVQTDLACNNHFALKNKALQPPVAEVYAKGIKLLKPLVTGVRIPVMP
jgi:hypothetical protein